ncbi:hypothetical protein [Thalassomonas actiniarum]|uniref:Uncharacterized protein n=1 Tax=Thalassomonas actiniarum TaxID=485447 RepID=A0AAF0BZH9_9GAMM|nr:hypothetical protein [Thalassomonas actiniarum]WDD96577.1 hypothetical protein SG35_014410 [Thalassomonas actiniarum]
MIKTLRKITPIPTPGQRIVQQSDLKRKNYLTLAGITDEALALVNAILDQADALFARTSLNLSAADKEKLIEINYYIKGLYRQEQTENATCIKQQLKCWYEQRQFLLQAVMTDGQKQRLKIFNRQLRFILDAVHHNHGNQKLNKLFNQLENELNNKQAFSGNNNGKRLTAAVYLPQQSAMLSINLAS